MMATAPKVTPVATDDTTVNTDTTATDDIPEEFTIPEEHIINDHADASMAPSIDMLNNMSPVNRQRDELERQKLSPPIGDWVKEDRWEMNDPRIIAEDSMPGDVNPNGRTMLSFSGKCHPRTVNNIDYDPMFFLRISPDKRMSQRNSDNVDVAYKLWLKVEELYLALYGAQWTTGKQLFDMLKNDRYIVRTYKGDNNPIGDIKKIDTKRK